VSCEYVCVWLCAHVGVSACVRVFFFCEFLLGVACVFGVRFFQYVYVYVCVRV